MWLLLGHLRISVIIKLVRIQVEMEVDGGLLGGPHDLVLLIVPLRSLCVIELAAWSCLVLYDRHVVPSCVWLEIARIGFVRCTHDFFAEFCQSFCLNSFWYFISIDDWFSASVLLAVVPRFFLFSVGVKIRISEPLSHAGYLLSQKLAVWPFNFVNWLCFESYVGVPLISREDRTVQLLYDSCSLAENVWDIHQSLCLPNKTAKSNWRIRAFVDFLTVVLTLSRDLIGIPLGVRVLWWLSVSLVVRHGLVRERLFILLFHSR